MIVAENLHKSFHGKRAVDGLSVRVSAGEAYGLVGPDGAGKTTTLRLLVGALLPDEGAVRIAGHDLRTDPELARERIGYLAQRFSLYGDLTVRENLGLFGSLRGLRGAPLDGRVAELIRFVGLEGFEGRRGDQL